MNNRWNKFIYKLGAVGYDKFFNSGKFLQARRQVFQDNMFDRERQRILFVGVGTGADLELIDTTKYDITAIDYSDAMLSKARAKFQNSSISFLTMDAQDLIFPENHFDIIVASLILSVVPNENKCMKEIVRVVKPNGKILIFDKFSPSGKGLPAVKKLLRPIIQVLGTDIGRNFEKLYQNHKAKLSVIEDRPILFNGMYRKIVLVKI